MPDDSDPFVTPIVPAIRTRPGTGAGNPSWEQSADWYARAVAGSVLNAQAADTALELLGPVEHLDVLDLGCGEGHVARRLAAAGARVTAVDPTARLLELAAAHGSAGITYRQLAAERLDGLADDCMDAVCAVLGLHHTDPLADALVEARRVLRPGGRLAAVIPHPAFDHPGAFSHDGHRVLGRYRDEGFWSTTRGGPAGSVHDIGWHHRTLASWLNALAGAGLAVRGAAEPPGPAERPWAGLSRFLAFRAA